MCLCRFGGCLEVRDMEVATWSPGVNTAVILMNLEKNKAHKWRRNNQGLILLTRPPKGDAEHDQDCTGPTCTRCGKWFCATCGDAATVEQCPRKWYFS